MIDSLMEFLTWLSDHTWLAYITVFTVAMLESLVVVGFFMPGVVMMFMFGALIGSGHLPWTIVWWVMAGAIVGDALSYWLGRHYHQHLQEIWPFRRYPKLFAAGSDYFHRHGGKSVFFGRFIGLIRPMIAVIAGMMSMPAWQFMLINILSAVVWSVLYLVPGVIFSASLSLAAEVAGRLVVFIIALVASIWLLSAITLALFRRLQPIGHWLVTRMDEWRLNHEFGHRLLYPVFDPVHGRVHEHLFVIASLWGGFLLWGMVLYWLLPIGGDALFNQAAYQMLQSLHNPLTTKIMVMVTQLGSITTIGPLYLLLAAWMLYRRYFSQLLLLAVVLIMAEGLMVMLKWLTAVERPMVIAGLQAGAFPSGHVLLSTLFYGALSVIIASRIQAAFRWLPYLALTLMLFAVAFSRLYLGAHWASDVIAAFLIALPLLIIAGIVIYRLPASNGRYLGITALLLLLLLLLGQYLWRYDDEVLRYQPPAPQARTLSPQQWLDGAWQQLPVQRDDLLQHHRPLNLQWHGSRESISAYLLLNGWQPVKMPGLEQLLQWFNPKADFHRLPIPNHIHGTRYQDLMFVRADEARQRWQVLRLWQSHYHYHGVPYWFGNLSFLETESEIGIRYLATVYKEQEALLQIPHQPPIRCQRRLLSPVRLMLCEFQPQ